MAVQDYRFILIVDGVRSVFTGTNCSRELAPLEFECTGPLPRLDPGRRIVEIVAVDPSTGLQSPSSNEVVAEIGADGRPRVVVRRAEGAAQPPPDVPPSLPSSTCAEPSLVTCFTVAPIATNIAPVRRLLPLTEDTLLVLWDNGTMTMLPSGTSQQLALGRSASTRTAAVDVAADAEFPLTRFLYFAVVAVAPDGTRTMDVIRVRELSERIAEPATIVPGLPLGASGNPALSVGPDGHIYLAVPVDTGGASALYGARVLRFTRDGAAAGHTRVGSPVLAYGMSLPGRLAWDAASRLLIASAVATPSPLAAVPFDVAAERGPATTGVVGADAATLTDLRDVSAAPGAGTQDDGAARLSTTLAFIAGNPQTLSIARLTIASPPELQSKVDVPLGPFVPTAVSWAGNGDLIVAATPAGGPGVLLRLRAHVRQ